jgi:hypothetical protein
VLFSIKRVKQEKKFLLFLFCLSFLIRFLCFNFFLKDKNLLSYDSAVYNDVALQIAQGHGITDANGASHFLRVPGYPIFLALGYKFFSNDIKRNLWIQIILASLIPILIFCLTLILFPANIFIAKICSLIGALHLGFVIFSGLVMAETFFVFSFLIFLILFLSNFHLFFSKKINDISLPQIFLAGLFLGFASMMRPVGHYLIVVSLFLILFSSMSLCQKVKSGFVLFSSWLLIVLPWLLRNFMLTGFLFFHTLPGIHFLKHFAARIEMERSGCSYMLALSKLNNELVILVKKAEAEKKHCLSEIENCLLLEKLSKNYCKKNVFSVLKYSFLNMFKTCFSLYSSELLFFDSNGSLPDYVKDRNIFLRFLFPQVSNKILIPVIYLEILFLLLLWIGFLGFIFKSFFNKELFGIVAQILPYIFLFIVISLACGFARLRLPIESLLIIFSVKFWYGYFIGDFN